MEAGTGTNSNPLDQTLVIEHHLRDGQITLRHFTGSEIRRSGMAAWMLDHDARSYALLARVFDGEREGLTRDDVLHQHHAVLAHEHHDLGGSALYWECKLDFFAPRHVTIPVAVGAFPDEQYQARGAGQSDDVRVL